MNNRRGGVKYVELREFIYTRRNGLDDVDGTILNCTDCRSIVP